MTTLVTTAIERLRGGAARSQDGDTLIELLIAIVIIALTFTALLGGLVTAITSSTTQQSLSTVDAILNNFAQSASFEAQQAFVNCTANPYRLISAPMPTSGPVGAEVTVFVTGFTPGHALTVTVGTTTATTVSSNGTPTTIFTDASGNATVSFLVPTGLSGNQNVSVSDGTSTTSPTPFVVGATTETKGQTPANYAISVGPVQQWNAQAASWVTSGSGTCPNSGAQQITAYATGPNGASGSLSFVVLHSATTTVLVVACIGTSPCPPAGSGSPPQPVLGASLTFTATVVPPNSTTPNPTGSVQWSFSQSPGDPTCNNSSLTNITGGNTSEASCTVTNAEVGTYEVTANYPASGTTGNYGTGSGSGSITVGEANSSTVLTTSSTPSPAQPGSKLSFTATIGASPANANDPTPQGTVVWTITPPSGIAPACSSGGDSQTLPANNGNGTNSTTCSFTLASNAPTGTYSASAVYQGDGDYNPSQSTSPATISVSKATPTLTFTPPQNPQTGSNFTVTVTVNGASGITPTGNVTWTVTPPSGTAPTCATSVLNGQGQATCAVNNAVTGTYTVAANYGGNGAYNAASGSTQVAVTLTPAGFDIQSVGSPADNKPDGGDKIVYTYNEAMSLNSIYPVRGGWNGSSVNVNAVFSRSNGATSLTIQCSGFGCTNPTLGTVSLGDTGSSHYIPGGNFGGTNTVTLTATMAASTNAAGQTVITITLTSSSSQFSVVSGNTILTWTPSNQATNAAGTACATTPVPESGSPKANL